MLRCFPGDVIPPNEREDAERAFIRFYNPEDDNDEDSQLGENGCKNSPPPQRYHELVEVHGQLDPLVSQSAGFASPFPIVVEMLIECWGLGVFEKLHDSHF